MVGIFLDKLLSWASSSSEELKNIAASSLPNKSQAQLMKLTKSEIELVCATTALQSIYEIVSDEDELPHQCFSLLTNYMLPLMMPPNKPNPFVLYKLTCLASRYFGLIS